LSLKENVNAIKEELSTEEQFLESVIKAEGFWKKYKKILIAVAVLVVVGLLAKVVMSYMQERNLEASNKAYNVLLKDSNDASALATLKSTNPKLYEMYLFKNSMARNDVSVLEKNQADIKDPILKNLMTYQIDSLNRKVSAVDAGVAQEFALVQEGYLLLKENKVKEAQAKFSQVSPESSLRSLVSNLKHYMGK